LFLFWQKLEIIPYGTQKRIQDLTFKNHASYI